MDSIKLYKQIMRGQLADLAKDCTVRVNVWNNGKPEATTKTLDGPMRLGQATGNFTQNDKGENELIEILAVGLNGVLGYQMGLGMLPIALIWVDMSCVLLSDNPDYDPTTDKDRIGGPSVIVDRSKESETPSTAPVVGDKSETGTIPVKTETGEVVYVNLGKLQEVLAKQRLASSPEVDETTKKYLTWGLYGLIGIAAITLLVVLGKQFTKPQPSTK